MPKATTRDPFQYNDIHEIGSVEKPSVIMLSTVFESIAIGYVLKSLTLIYSIAKCTLHYRATDLSKSSHPSEEILFCVVVPI